MSETIEVGDVIEISYHDSGNKIPVIVDKIELVLTGLSRGRADAFLHVRYRIGDKWLKAEIGIDTFNEWLKDPQAATWEKVEDYPLVEMESIDKERERLDTRYHVAAGSLVGQWLYYVHRDSGHNEVGKVLEVSGGAGNTGFRMQRQEGLFPATCYIRPEDVLGPAPDIEEKLKARAAELVGSKTAEEWRALSQVYGDGTMAYYVQFVQTTSALALDLSQETGSDVLVAARHISDAIRNLVKGTEATDA